MTKSKSRTFGKKLARTFKSLDLFGEGVNFQIDEKGTYNTIFGTLVSILLLS